jgi:hypothetical protein
MTGYTYRQKSILKKYKIATIYLTEKIGLCPKNSIMPTFYVVLHPVRFVLAQTFP